jgi:hypothetical protein
LARKAAAFILADVAGGRRALVAGRRGQERARQRSVARAAAVGVLLPGIAGSLDTATASDHPEDEGEDTTHRPL